MIERVNQSTTPGDPTWGTKSRLTLLCMIALVSGVERLAAQEKVEVRGVTSNGKGSSSLPIFVLLRADNVQNDGSDVGPRTIKRKINTPVLYTTGQGLTDGMQAMFVERFGFLAKPYTPEQLVIAVENLLSKN